MRRNLVGLYRLQYFHHLSSLFVIDCPFICLTSGLAGLNEANTLADVERSGKNGLIGEALTPIDGQNGYFRLWFLSL